MSLTPYSIQLRLLCKAQYHKLHICEIGLYMSHVTTNHQDNPQLGVVTNNHVIVWIRNNLNEDSPFIFLTNCVKVHKKTRWMSCYLHLEYFHLNMKLL